MQVSEILRKIADIVDQEESGVEAGPVTQAEPPAVPVPQPASNARITVTRTGGEIDPLGNEDECCRDEAQPEVTMVSPLQQEHELLKKSQGVDNNVSEFADDEYQDELAAMKQSAGIGEEQASAKAQDEQREMESQLNPRKNAAIAFAKARTDRSA